MPEDRCCDGPERTTASRRGRPVQISEEERRETILDAAAELLCSHRLDDVTIATICNRVKMSKRTVYALFSTREELLGTCLARLGAAMFRPLQPDERSLSLEERLRALLTLNKAAFPESAPLEILRVMIAEAHTYPNLARKIAQEGHDKVIRLLSDELRSAVRSGEIAIADNRIEEAAEMLFNMVYGGAIYHLLDTSRPQTGDAEAKRARRDLAVTVFLNGVRTGK